MGHGPGLALPGAQCGEGGGLTPEEWQRAKVLLAEALELPAGERASFLDSRCGGDPALRRELDALLAASDGDGFLDGEPALPGPGSGPVTPATPAAPAITVGEVLGPYEIEKKLGEGGMGEVYQALDSRLGRRVAIKILPVRLSQNASALKRFERETKALAALSHPNILAIFDVGRHGGTAFAVTELLTGATLRERLERGRLPVATAVEIATQAARGLAVAHAEGIVHRDLKPENLFLTAGGPVKVLDFGIAAFTPLWGGPDEAFRLTADHAVLGTARYMSPEQAKGETCDHRSDIFSLGAVLYEMLTGSPAFPGEAAIDALFAVIELEPAPLETLCPSASPQLVRLVHRCLDKDPARRFQSASDLAFHLESLVASASALTALAPPTPSISPVGRRRGLLRAGALAGLLLAAAFLAGFLVQRRWGQSEPPSFQRLTFRRGNVVNARFAPDGQTIVLSATWDGEPYQIFTTRTDSPESRLLGLPSSNLHSISPGGEMLIGLARMRDGGLLGGSTLAQVPLAGGAPRPILETSLDLWADWAPNGESFALLRHLMNEARIEYPRGKVIWRSQRYTWDLRVAPAGDALAFCESGAGQSVIVLDRSGKVVTRSDGWNLPVIQSPRRNPTGCVGWAPGGDEVWFAATRPGGESGLYALSRHGEVRPLLNVPGTLALLDIARDGRVLLAQLNQRRSIVVRAPGETTERNLSWFESSELADLSVNGRCILFSDRGQRGGKQVSVYLRGTDGSPAVRLGDGWALALSPDGHWALAADEAEHLLLLPTGAGEPRVLPPLAMDITQGKWLPGGKQLLLQGSEPGKGEGLYVLDIGTKKVRPVIREEKIFHYLPSPDGSMVAVWGLDDMKLYPLGGGEPRKVPEGLLTGDYPIQWRADGLALYIGRRRDRGRYSIDEVDLATGRRRQWKELRVADLAADGIRFPIVTPGGEAYAYSMSSSQSTLYLIEGLR